MITKRIAGAAVTTFSALALLTVATATLRWMETKTIIAGIGFEMHTGLWESCFIVIKDGYSVCYPTPERGLMTAIKICMISSTVITALSLLAYAMMLCNKIKKIWVMVIFNLVPALLATCGIVLYTLDMKIDVLSFGYSYRLAWTGVFLNFWASLTMLYYYCKLRCGAGKSENAGKHKAWC